MVIADRPVPKIPATRIPSDSCEIRIGRESVDGEITKEGTPYYTHMGEWVEVIPVKSIAEMVVLTRLQGNILDDAGATLADMNKALADLCEKLSKRVVEWSWTDIVGEPLPNPYKNSDVLMELGTEELFWLINCLSIETPDARKNG